MKRLLLLRHAKSSWDDPGLEDFDRPLSARGAKAAPLVGCELARRGWILDLALVSPARRAEESWALVHSEMPASVEVARPRPLYPGSPPDLLAEIQRTPETVATLLLIGHNPGLERLAGLLAGRDSDAQALAELRRKFPTAALAVLEQAGPWANFAQGSASLTHFLKVKDLPESGQ